MCRGAGGGHPVRGRGRVPAAGAGCERGRGAKGKMRDISQRAATWYQASGRIFVRQREATIFVVAVLLLVYFATKSSAFLGESDITNLLSGIAAPIIIIAIGEVLLLICGEIDLSVGYVVTFTPFLMHYLIDFYGVPVIPAIVVALLLGLVVGWVNGFVTVTLGVPSFITTLGTGFVLLGIVLTTSHAYPVSIPPSAATLGRYLGADPW